MVWDNIYFKNNFQGLFLTTNLAKAICSIPVSSPNFNQLQSWDNKCFQEDSTFEFQCRNSFGLGFKDSTSDFNCIPLTMSLHICSSLPWKIVTARRIAFNFNSFLDILEYTACIIFWFFISWTYLRGISLYYSYLIFSHQFTLRNKLPLT